jgi:hypothetical protein
LYFRHSSNIQQLPKILEDFQFIFLYLLFEPEQILLIISLTTISISISISKQQKQAYLLDIAVPNSHNITQTYNTKINKYLELSVAMRNLWCLEKISILPFIISATGIVPQSLFKNLKILDLDNKLVVEIQKGILLYSCHIVRKFLNIDTEHKTQKSQNVEARRR